MSIKKFGPNNEVVIDPTAFALQFDINTGEIPAATLALGGISHKCFGAGFAKTHRFTFDAFPFAITDEGASNAFGSVALLTVPTGMRYWPRFGRLVLTTASDQDGGLASTSALDVGCGTTAIAAGAATLSGAQEDVMTAATLGFSSGELSGSPAALITAVASPAIETAATFYLNAGGAAAVVDADTTILLTGVLDLHMHWIGLITDDS